LVEVVMLMSGSARHLPRISQINLQQIFKRPALHPHIRSTMVLHYIAPQIRHRLSTQRLVWTSYVVPWTTIRTDWGTQHRCIYLSTEESHQYRNPYIQRCMDGIAR
jgi:hypothetical protein